MAHRLIRLDDVPPRPWLNGGGTARDLLVVPESAPWQGRVGVAEVERDGPFSHYPGVERWFAVLKGAGVDLAIDGAPKSVTRRDEPLRFDGGAATTCRLVDGPTLDLNLMLRDAQGGLFLAADTEPWRPNAGQCGLFTAASGRCHLDASENDIEVPAYALLWFDAAPAELTFFANQRPAAATAWWLAVTLAGAPR